MDTEFLTAEREIIAQRKLLLIARTLLRLIMRTASDELIRELSGIGYRIIDEKLEAKKEENENV